MRSRDAAKSDPMGEGQLNLFPLDYNRWISIEYRPVELTRDTGVLVLRKMGAPDRLAGQPTDVV